MVEAGIAPSKLGRSIVLPTVKNVNKSLNDIENYRPVSIIAIVAKVFEACVSLMMDDMLSFNENQFGFVKGGGCSKAIFSLNASVKYFNERGSNVYLCALDASKAFDRVNHFHLFQCLIERGFNLNLVKVFVSWFRNMRCCVKWNNVVSEFVDIKSGVPQGSILGGKFFNMLMDKLLKCVDETGLGCTVNSQFAGALAYADDLVIMSASVVNLQKMLNACVQFGYTCDLKFNVLKSCCAYIGKPVVQVLPDMLLDSLVLPWVDNFTYLGVVFQTGHSLRVDCKPRVQKFIASVCSVLRNKVIGYENVFAQILIRKCLPVLSYGLECVFLNSQSIRSVTQAWNLSFRWLFNYRKYDSTRLLFLSNDTMSMNYLLDLTILSFYASLKSSDNKLLHNLLIYMYSDCELLRLHEKYELLLGMCSRNDINSSVFNGFMCYCVEKM
jgi:hypothetical protein